MSNVKVQPANGRLGVMCVGLGAVTTTTIVGVLMARKGLAKPIGSFACDGMMRLGKGREKVYKEVKDIIPVPEGGEPVSDSNPVTVVVQPYMDVTVKEVDTESSAINSITVDIDENGGEIDLDYMIELNNSMPVHNGLHLTIRKVESRA